MSDLISLNVNFNAILNFLKSIDKFIKKISFEKTICIVLLLIFIAAIIIVLLGLGIINSPKVNKIDPKILPFLVVLVVFLGICSVAMFSIIHRKIPNPYLQFRLSSDELNDTRDDPSNYKVTCTFYEKENNEKRFKRSYKPYRDENDILCIRVFPPSTKDMISINVINKKNGKKYYRSAWLNSRDIELKAGGV